MSSPYHDFVFLDRIMRQEKGEEGTESLVYIFVITLKFMAKIGFLSIEQHFKN
jgi:hypothetical protein